VINSIVNLRLLLLHMCPPLPQASRLW